MEKVRWFSHFNAVYQFINCLSYDWPGTIYRLNHLLNCSANYNALVPFALRESSMAWNFISLPKSLTKFRDLKEL